LHNKHEATPNTTIPRFAQQRGKSGFTSVLETGTLVLEIGLDRIYRINRISALRMGYFIL